MLMRADSPKDSSQRRLGSLCNVVIIRSVVQRLPRELIDRWLGLVFDSDLCYKIGRLGYLRISEMKRLVEFTKKLGLKPHPLAKRTLEDVKMWLDC